MCCETNTNFNCDSKFKKDRKQVNEINLKDTRITQIFVALLFGF